MITTFEKFEHSVMQKILEKDTSISKILREQYQQSHVINREFSGVGFFTHFKVQAHVPKITDPVTQSYGNVLCDINGIENFGGFVLFIENGIITFLEGYSFDGEWPTIITSYSLHHAI